MASAIHRWAVAGTFCKQTRKQTFLCEYVGTSVAIRQTKIIYMLIKAFGLHSAVVKTGHLDWTKLL
jgi:hypothetical protein